MTIDISFVNFEANYVLKWQVVIECRQVVDRTKIINGMYLIHLEHSSATFHFMIFLKIYLHLNNTHFVMFLNFPCHITYTTVLYITLFLKITTIIFIAIL